MRRKEKREKREDVYELISYNIRKYRKKRGLTQYELAEKTHYSHEFIRRVEAPHSKKFFSIDTISNIADALDIDLRRLLDNVDQDELKKRKS